jgi:hypothetical protein
MVGTQRPELGRLAALGCWTVLLVVSSSARAIYLDEDQNITFRARIYSEASIRTQNSQVDTTPEAKAGQLVQHRNFFNPELDAKLTSYTTWMKGTFLDFLAPDDLRFRAAAWGFYDGIYDYGSGQFNEVQKHINDNFESYNRGICSPGAANAGQSCDSNADCMGGVCQPSGAWFLHGPKLNVPAGCSSTVPGSCLVDNIHQLLPHSDLDDPRGFYSLDRRINELYLSYSKGPFFLRLGRQAISWGESDTIALLDQSNPFDVRLAAPGLFEDVDEARIPLWTIRSSYNLFDTLGPLSSGFIEAYWVPGNIDTRTARIPILTASPYSPRGRNPQFSSGFPNETYQFVLFDHTPEAKFQNSRYGFRFQTVLNRFFTLQAWLYTTFPQQAVPRHAAPVIVKPGTGGARITQPAVCSPFSSCSPLFVTEIVHKRITVYGLAGTFFFEPLDSIVRLNAQMFENEPGFIPEYNLNIGNPDGKSPVTDAGTVPTQDVLRWEIGLDRFFFFRPLNPTNSFTVSLSQVGGYNLDETSLKDFRFGGQRKPGTDVIGVMPVPDDFVQQKKVEAFAQITLLTDYMHGRLNPQVTWIQNVRGTYAFHPQITYRWSDSLLFRLDYVTIGGEYQGVGFFRDRDQVSFRATYQLN